MREILRLDGESADRRAGYGEALVGAAGGVVTADARAAFDKALAEQPGLPAARFYLGLAAEQDGDKPKAIAIYQGLLAETPAGAPWAAALEARLAAVKGESAPSAPAPAASNETPAAAAGESTAASNAAPAAADDAQQAQIRGMVERLATRLAQSGGDAEQWGRLIRSYSVLREPDKARDALAAARKALAGDAAAGAGLDALAQELGIEGASAASASAPASEVAAPSAPAPSTRPPAGESTVASNAAPATADDAQQAHDPRHGRAAGDAPGAERRRRRANGSALFAPIRCCTNRTRRKDALAAARKALAGDAAAGRRPRRAGAANWESEADW